MKCPFRIKLISVVYVVICRNDSSENSEEHICKQRDKRIEELERFVDILYEKAKLHEDNIDELQVR